MLVFFYILSIVAVTASFGFLSYKLSKKVEFLEKEIESMGAVVCAHDKKFDRRIVEASVKIISAERRISEISSKIDKSMEHLEAQNSVLSQRITSMKKDAQERE